METFPFTDFILFSIEDDNVICVFARCLNDLNSSYAFPLNLWMVPGCEILVVLEIFCSQCQNTFKAYFTSPKISWFCRLPQDREAGRQM